MASIAKTCDNVRFPKSRRPRACGAQLAKTTLLKDGSIKFYAIKTYCYKSIIEALETLLKRPGQEEECEKWRTRAVNNNMFADVYDGKVWKQFGNWKGNKPFLNLP